MPLLENDIKEDSSIYKIYINKAGIAEGEIAGDGSVHKSIREAFEKWESDGKPGNAICEITDCESYEEDDLLITLPAETKVVIRSKQERRPVIFLNSPFKIEGEKGSELNV